MIERTKAVNINGEVIIIRKMEGKKELVAEREAGIDKYGEALLMTD